MITKTQIQISEIIYLGSYLIIMINTILMVILENLIVGKQIDLQCISSFGNNNTWHLYSSLSDGFPFLVMMIPNYISYDEIFGANFPYNGICYHIVTFTLLWLTLLWCSPYYNVWELSFCDVHLMLKLHSAKYSIFWIEILSV